MTFAVIFDVDGVLIDSYDAHFQSWRQLADEQGSELSETEFAASFGRTSREVLQAMWPDRSLSTDQIQFLEDRKESLFRELIRGRVPVMEGATSLWKSLIDCGARIAIGSSGPPANIHLVLERLDADRTASAVITGADVTRGKPDPEVFLLAAERMHIAPHRCVVLEDAPAGIAAARAARMACVGVASTGRTRHELSGANRVVDRLNEISATDLAMLASQNGDRERS